MKLNTFLLSFEKELEVKKGTFKESKILNKIPQWDSLAVMTFISFANKKFKRNVNPDSLSKCKTVGDLGKLLKLKN